MGPGNKVGGALNKAVDEVAQLNCHDKKLQSVCLPQPSQAHITDHDNSITHDNNITTQGHYP